MSKLDTAALAQLFTEARTRNGWKSDPVPEAVLRDLYDLVKFGPTAANACPARFVFVKSPEAKAKLAPALDEGNREKTLAAPVTVKVGYDMAFYDKLPVLFPHTDAKSWFEGPREGRHVPAFRNGSLQGAYLILAARALGLDCGPMSGCVFKLRQRGFEICRFGNFNFLVNLGQEADQTFAHQCVIFDYQQFQHYCSCSVLPEADR